MLERVNGAGGRLRKLLDELELVVWINGGRAPPGVEPCSLGALVEGALGKIERAIAQRNVVVRREVPLGLPAFEGDAELLGAALEYTLDFAVARSGGRSIDVVATSPSTLVVTDEGGGADSAVLGRLFEPFIEKELIPRPEPGARRRDRLGLGLAIARGIFVAHGGGIDAKVAPDGRGITLECALVRAG
jgi:K+-sensing histidine kinase KdpD